MMENLISEETIKIMLIGTEVLAVRIIKGKSVTGFNADFIM